MRTEFRLLTLGILIALLFVSLASAQFSSTFSKSFVSTNPYSGLTSSSSFGAFDSNSCQAGQDFLLQVSPKGCLPSVVRSDLLEEQDVPVYCPVVATKINPLIDVDSINSISFSGGTPGLTSSPGFLPMRAALAKGVSSEVNPVLGEIGYAVIVLKQNKNESSMPDFVEGNLNARISYDIENAFGVGQSSFYLPAMTDADWERDYGAYSFWENKGYLRAENVGVDGATIAIYSGLNSPGIGGAGKQVIARVNIPVGGTSDDISISGFDTCLGSMNLHLDGLEVPDTTARVEVNGDFFEIRQGDRFLENRCSVRDINAKGIVERLVVDCDEDDGRETYNLISSPRVKIQIGEDSPRVVGLGDKIYLDEKGERSVYVAYMKTTGDSKNKEDLSVYFLAAPGVDSSQNNLDEDQLNMVARFMNSFPNQDLSSVFSLTANVYRAYASLIESAFRIVVNGESFKQVSYTDTAGKDIFGKTVKVLGFADPVDIDISKLDENSKKNYENALRDYQDVIDSFADGNYPPEEKEVLGAQALRGLIELQDGMGQKRTVLELCEDFEDNYPNSALPKECKDEAKLSNSQPSSRDVLVQGRIYRLSLDRIKQPSFDDFGAVVFVKNGDGTSNSYRLKKDSIVYLDTEVKYSYDAGIDSSAINYRYRDGWQWSPDNENWMSVSTTTVSGGSQNGNSPVEEQITVIDKLNDLNSLSEGVSYLKSIGAVDKSTSEFIQLVEVSEDAIRLRVGLKKESVVNSAKQFFLETEVKTLRRNVPDGFGSSHLFTLQQVNLNLAARVSVKPKINYAETTSTFPFKIGIEKRAIQLSPEKTQERIESLNKTIEKWENINEKLGKAVEVGNKMCLGVGTYLTVKNFFSTLSGEGLARQKVMRGEGGYFKICEDEKRETGVSVSTCLLNKNPEIEADVDAYAEAIRNQNERIKDLQSGILTEKIIGEDVVDTGKLMEKYVDENYRNSLGSSLDNGGLTSVEINGKTVKVSDIVKNINPDTTYLTQARDLELSAQLLSSGGTVGSVAKGEVEKTLADIWVNSQKEIDRNTASQKYGIAEVGLISTGVAKELPITSRYTFGDVKSKFDPSVSGIENDNSYSYIVKDYKDSSEYLLVLDDNFVVDATYKIDGKNLILQSTNNPLSLKPKYYDTGTYQNPYPDGTAEVKYYETGQYAGLPAIVPFDVKNGWYAGVKSTLPIGGNIKAYQDSGKVSSFYLCNIGKNQKQEFYSSIGDDKCVMINPSTNTPYNKFPGLEDKEAATLASAAVQAIADASRQYDAGISDVRINSPSGSPQSIKVGAPSVGVPDIQCQDFMSPVECNLLFNVCDPVVCPNSRCNLGGTYPVADVVQSGIAGSVALCLPNFPEVKVPVCLSGIYAGVEGYLSVLDNYQSCLQKSLETGEQIGICDELHSVYMCEFLWRQGLPIANAVVPQVIGKVLSQGNTRGGGEYLGVQNAWSSAKDSASFFAQNYAVNSYEAFQLRSTDGVGTEVCRNWISLRAPDGGSLLDSITKPRVPAQFYGRFDEIPFTDATVPPTSHYKVFYHVYAGESSSYYQVYLKGTSQAFFQDTPSKRVIASDFIAGGEYATETVDFQATSGFTELCIVVNNQEECGFKQVTTDYGLNYLTEKYVTDEAKRRDITSSGDCVSGSPNIAGLLSPALSLNPQARVEEAINPAIYNRGITRICSTDNPGSATDEFADQKGSRWVKVGYCDITNMGCWLDTMSVRDTIKDTGLEEETVGEVSNDYFDDLRKENGLLNSDEFKKVTESIKKEKNLLQKINLINLNIGKVFYHHEKGYLTLLRGGAYGRLALMAWGEIVKANDSNKDDGDRDSKGDEGDGDTSKKDQEIVKKSLDKINSVPLTEDGRRVGADIGTQTSQIDIVRYSGFDNFFGDWLDSDISYEWNGRAWIVNGRSNPISVPSEQTILETYRVGLQNIRDISVGAYNEGHLRKVVLSCNNPQGPSISIELFDSTNIGFTDIVSIVDSAIRERCGSNVQSEGNSLIFEFQDGTSASNLYYKFYNGKWYWSPNKKVWSVPGEKTFAEGYVSIGSLSDKNEEFINRLSQTSSLKEGFNALMQRTLDNDEEGWFFGTSLVTNDAEFWVFDKGFILKLDPPLGRVYFRNSNSFALRNPEIWEWSFDKDEWFSLSDTLDFNEYKSSDLFRQIFLSLKSKNFIEGAAIIFGVDGPGSSVNSGGATIAETCQTQEECQKYLGNEIVDIAKNLKENRISSVSGLADDVVKKDTGLPNFECLALAVAYQESRIQHCGSKIGTGIQEDGNPLYCNGDLAQILKGDKEDSLGVMQINKKIHGEKLEFLENANYGAAYLIVGYDSEPKKFTVKNKDYIGWERSLRNYNGWGTGGNPNYVEDVLSLESIGKLKELFPSICY